MEICIACQGQNLVFVVGYLMTAHDTAKMFTKIARQNLAMAEFFLQQKRYANCILSCYLAIEKFLQAYYVHTQSGSELFTKDLTQIARLANLSLPEADKALLDFLTKTYSRKRLGFTHNPPRAVATHYYAQTCKFLEQVMTILQEIEIKGAY